MDLGSCTEFTEAFHQNTMLYNNPLHILTNSQSFHSQMTAETIHDTCFIFLFFKVLNMPCITIDCNRIMSEFNTVEKHIHQQSVHSHSLRRTKKKRRAGSSQIYALVLKIKSTDRETAAFTCILGSSVIANGAVEKKKS